MTAIDTEYPLSMPSAVDTNLFIIPRGAELVQLYAKNKKDIIPTYKKLKKEEKEFYSISQDQHAEASSLWKKRRCDELYR